MQRSAATAGGADAHTQETHSRSAIRPVQHSFSRAQRGLQQRRLGRSAAPGHTKRPHSSSAQGRARVGRPYVCRPPQGVCSCLPPPLALLQCCSGPHTVSRTPRWCEQREQSQGLKPKGSPANSERNSPSGFSVRVRAIALARGVGGALLHRRCSLRTATRHAPRASATACAQSAPAQRSDVGAGLFSNLNTNSGAPGGSSLPAVGKASVCARPFSLAALFQHTHTIRSRSISVRAASACPSRSSRLRGLAVLRAAQQRLHAERPRRRRGQQLIGEHTGTCVPLLPLLLRRRAPEEPQGSRNAGAGRLLCFSSLFAGAPRRGQANAQQLAWGVQVALVQWCQQHLRLVPLGLWQLVRDPSVPQCSKGALRLPAGPGCQHDAQGSGLHLCQSSHLHRCARRAGGGRQFAPAGAQMASLAQGCPGPMTIVAVCWAESWRASAQRRAKAAAITRCHRARAAAIPPASRPAQRACPPRRAGPGQQRRRRKTCM